jgi:ATP-binding cassette, subfamily A (ABC1), member 3
LVAQEDIDVELEVIREKNNSKIFWMHFWALIKKRVICFKRDVKSLICEIILPIIIIWVGLAFTRIQIIKQQPRVEFTPKIWGLPTNEIWVNTGFELVTDKIPTLDTKVV